MQIKTFDHTPTFQRGCPTVYNIWKPDKQDSTKALLGLPTSITCTDFLTDKLMYPTAQPINFIFPLTTDKVRLVISYEKAQSYHDFLKYGLPLINKIEKVNRYKQTEIVYKDEKNSTIAILGSKKWVENTFNLSMYAKFFRNFIHDFKHYQVQTLGDLQKLPFKDHIFCNDFVYKIIFTKNLNYVHKNCKYKHGWINEKAGDHSNNGIYYTLTQPLLHPNTLAYDWQKERYKQLEINFERTKNVKYLHNLLKDINLNAMPIL